MPRKPVFEKDCQPTVFFLSPPFIDIHTHRQAGPDSLLSWGIHPWWLDDSDYDVEDALGRLETALRDDRLAMIGETGVDRLHQASLPRQLEVFERHILLAERYGKPLVIHNVKGTAEVLRLHRTCHPRQPWIIHGFNGTAEEARQLTARDIFLSVGTALLYQNRKIQQSLSSIPLDCLFFETDEYPGEVQEIYARAAERLELPIAVLRERIFANFGRLNLKTWKTGETVHVCSSATRV